MQLAVKKLERKTLRVFIVEDAMNVITTLKDLVDTVENARIVGVARNETVATEWAMSNRAQWDLAIVDILLDQGSGLNLIRRLKRQPGAGHVVVFSGFITEVVKQHCLSLGADAVFQKGESRALAEYVDSLSVALKAVAGCTAPPPRPAS
jgi:two-component system OmpR family response regulator